MEVVVLIMEVEEVVHLDKETQVKQEALELTSLVEVVEALVVQAEETLVVVHHHLHQ